MIRIFAAGVLCLSITPAFSAGAKTDGNYYENLLKGLKSKVQGKLESKTRVSAVAAVRGARQGSDSGALYWKGGVSEQAGKKLAEEKKALADAVQLVVDGKTGEGRAALEKFIKDHPESVYAPDAKEALSGLPAEAEPAKPAAEAPETKPQEEKTRPAETAPAGTTSEK